MESATFIDYVLAAQSAKQRHDTITLILVLKVFLLTATLQCLLHSHSLTCQVESLVYFCTAVIVFHYQTFNVDKLRWTFKYTVNSTILV